MMRTRLVRKSIVIMLFSGTSSTSELAGSSWTSAALAASAGWPTCERREIADAERGVRAWQGGCLGFLTADGAEVCRTLQAQAGLAVCLTQHTATAPTHQLRPQVLGRHLVPHGDGESGLGVKIQRAVGGLQQGGTRWAEGGHAAQLHAGTATETKRSVVSV